jgi:RNA-binding protein
MLKVGKAGLSEGFIRSVDVALTQHELVKIKFAEFKAEKKELAPQLAEKTASHLVMRVGNVMVLHRPKPVVEEAAGK